MPRLAVEVRLETRDTAPPLRWWLGPMLRRAARLAGVAGGSLGVAVVGDERMSELHARHTGVAGPTDVLTFDLRGPVPDAEGDRFLDGDLVICLDEARRQAERRSHPIRLEALLYAVHGMLHLLGYDDHGTRDAARMHAEEDRLLAALGVGAVYARPATKRPTRRPSRRPPARRSAARPPRG